jgi:hypothetical protein
VSQNVENLVPEKGFEDNDERKREWVIIADKVLSEGQPK